MDISKACEELGIKNNPKIILDNQIHRFFIDGEKSPAGWIVGFKDNGIVVIGNWKTGEKRSIKIDDTLQTETENIEDIQREANEMLAKVQAQWIMENNSNVKSNEYLKRKKILPRIDLRQEGDKLFIPLYNKKGEIVTGQWVSSDGTKRFLPGGKVSGAFYFFGDYKKAKTVIFCEGYATGSSIYDAIKLDDSAVIACMAGNNLEKVAKELKEDIKGKQFVFADNDKNGVGIKYAQKTGLPFFITEKKDANDYAQEYGIQKLSELIETEIKKITENKNLIIPFDDLSNSDTVSWLVKGMIPQNGLGMLFGQSGVGKSFCALDLAFSVASNSDWMGLPSKNENGRPVVYFAGEGLRGMYKRASAWKIKNDMDKVDNAYLSKRQVTLTDHDEMEKVIESLDQLDKKPILIIIDTLHRHWSGDENSSADAKVMIDACTGLQDRYGATVLLIHHTGVNQEAQGRSRGSSAWKAALDFELSLSKYSSDTICLKQTKNKEAEPISDRIIKKEVITLPIKEDGENVTSLVYTYTGLDDKEYKEAVKEESDRSTLVHIIQNAENVLIDENNVSIKIKDLKNAIKKVYPEKSENSITQMVKPSAKKYLIGKMILSGSVEIASYDKDTIKILDQDIIEIIHETYFIR